MLETLELTKLFGGLCAINSLSLNVEEGEIVGLIGPNGAGKTTLFNLATGFIPPTSGKITFRGKGHRRSEAPCHSPSGAGSDFSTGEAAARFHRPSKHGCGNSSLP